MELRDKFGRVHDYLRISLVDKCNLRCSYCMPEDAHFLPQSQLLSRAEIAHLAKVFVDEFGIKKIRLTGGEPLVRADFNEILSDLSGLGISLAMTTNGILLHKHLPQLRQAGLTSLNISLDTFQPDKFFEITRRNVYDQVWNNVELALAEGFRVKLNMVVVNGLNENELCEFVSRTNLPGLHVRFIEFMPFEGNRWLGEKVYSYQDMLDQIEAKYEIEKIEDKPHSTSKAYRVKGYAGSFAVISTVTAPFCGDCNRIRLTADGKIRNCLFATREFDLLTPLRAGQDVKAIIQTAISEKEAKLGGLPEFTDRENLMKSLSGRSMVNIGG